MSVLHKSQYLYIFFNIIYECNLDQLKFVYFSINVTLANRMCNFAVEIDVENYKGLNSLCRASWLLDHNMFEVNIIILYINFNI